MHRSNPDRQPRRRKCRVAGHAHRGGVVQYVASPRVLQRALELRRQAGVARVSAGDDVEHLDRATAALRDCFDVELGVWSDPDADLDHGDLDTVTVELAASWVCLGMFELLALAVLVEQTVTECWPDKAAAWREHVLEVSITIAEATGDTETAAEYLRRYTEELLDRPDGSA